MSESAPHASHGVSPAPVLRSGEGVMPSLATAIVALRIGTAGLFMAHAVVRLITPGSVAQFGGFLSNRGIPQGVAVVWLLTAYEILAGVLLMIGYRARIISAGFAVILITGIVLIHRHLGWFVGEHGTGGSEYSVALLLALLVIAAADGGAVGRGPLVVHALDAPDGQVPG